jgi:hypothetical protein
MEKLGNCERCSNHEVLDDSLGGEWLCSGCLNESLAALDEAKIAFERQPEEPYSETILREQFPGLTLREAALKIIRRDG